jgi:hypothetical protein
MCSISRVRMMNDAELRVLSFQMSYAEQSDKLAGPIALLKQSVYMDLSPASHCLSLHNHNAVCIRHLLETDSVLVALGTLPGARERPPRMRRRSSVDEASPPVVWASSSRMYVFCFRVLSSSSSSSFSSSSSPSPYANFHSLHGDIDAHLQYHRTSPFDAILGGAEDVMADLGVKQALRRMPKNARL